MAKAVFLGIGLGLFLLPLIAESVTSWIAIRWAKKHHPALWEHSGRPTLIGNGTVGSAWPLVRYYRDREWMKSRRPHRDAPRTESGWLGPVTDQAATAFAERLRGPLLWSYWAALMGIPASAVFLVVGGLVLF